MPVKDKWTWDGLSAMANAASIAAVEANLARGKRILCFERGDDDGELRFVVVSVTIDREGKGWKMMGNTFTGTLQEKDNSIKI